MSQRFCGDCGGYHWKTEPCRQVPVDPDASTGDGGPPPPDNLAVIRAQAERIEALEAALRGLVQDIDEWNESVVAIIGRQPETWTWLERARTLLSTTEPDHA